MSTDVKLGDNANPHHVIVEANALNVTASDLMLDQPGRRLNPAGFRRALVHDQSDGITINYNGDYPGGTTINQAQIQLKPIKQDSVTNPKLPVAAELGHLAFVHSEVNLMGQQVSEDSALWICTRVQGGIAMWQMVPLGGEIVPGTI